MTVINSKMDENKKEISDMKADIKAEMGAMMDKSWTYQSPFGPSSTTTGLMLKNPKITSDYCWGNDDDKKSRYEADEVTCKSDQYIEINPPDG